MIKIIGQENCSRCAMAKTLLERNNIEYEYCLLSALLPEEQNQLMEKAQAMGLLNFPLILKDEKLTTLQEAMQ